MTHSTRIESVETRSGEHQVRWACSCGGYGWWVVAKWGRTPEERAGVLADAHIAKSVASERVSL